MITVSLLTSLRGGVLSRLLSISIASLAEWLEETLRGDDLRVEARLERERRRTCSTSRRSSITDEATTLLP